MVHVKGPRRLVFQNRESYRFQPGRSRPWQRPSLGKRTAAPVLPAASSGRGTPDPGAALPTRKSADMLPGRISTAAVEPSRMMSLSPTSQISMLGNTDPNVRSTTSSVASSISYIVKPLGHDAARLEPAGGHLIKLPAEHAADADHPRIGRFGNDHVIFLRAELQHRPRVFVDKYAPDCWSATPWFHGIKQSRGAQDRRAILRHRQMLDRPDRRAPTRR